MRTIVITGSTRGIGYGMAEAFLERGCAVVVGGRRAESTAAAAQRLAERYGAERVFGQPCDVMHYEQVQALWDVAKQHFGHIDIWVNNAGISNAPAPLWEQPSDCPHNVVNTNLVGTMYGSMVALRGMLAQGSGALYNLEGLGADGRQIQGMAIYGITKSGVRYLNRALASETKGTPVIVGALLPGMVATDMLSSQYEGKPDEWARVKPIFNILSDRVETVAPWLVDKMLQNQKNGACISRSNGFKLGFRFLSSLFHKRHIFD
jgi:NAD(P)-dependent dehydrogenase (short-subunit alcohol dehydrogenase family)